MKLLTRREIATVGGKFTSSCFSVQLRYNYRLDLWPRQRIAPQKAFGCARAAFNDGLRAREAAREAGEPYVTDGELSARLTAVKRPPGRARPKSRQEVA